MDWLVDEVEWTGRWLYSVAAVLGKVHVWKPMLTTAGSVLTAF